MTVLFTGCGKNGYDKISYDEYKKLIDDKSSFPLVIGRETCSACEAYKTTMEKFIKKYGVDVKYIDLDDLTDSQENEIINDYPISGTPTTIFVKNGEEEDKYNRIVGNAKYSKTEDMYRQNGYIK